MDLSHYTELPLTFDPTRTYAQPPVTYEHQKPYGFWVSVDGEMDWPEWAATENFHPVRLTHRSIVRLKPDANVRVINTLEEFDQFEREFAHVSVGGWRERLKRGIDWQKVALSYSGIIITEYFWARRLIMLHVGDTAVIHGYDGDLRPITVNWFYAWDCASGCIWDLEAIESVTPAASARPDGFYERLSLSQDEDEDEDEDEEASEVLGSIDLEQSAIADDGPIYVGGPQ